MTAITDVWMTRDGHAVTNSERPEDVEEMGMYEITGGTDGKEYPIVLNKLARSQMMVGVRRRLDAGIFGASERHARHGGHASACGDGTGEVVFADSKAICAVRNGGPAKHGDGLHRVQRCDRRQHETAERFGDALWFEGSAGGSRVSPSFVSLSGGHSVRRGGADARNALNGKGACSLQVLRPYRCKGGRNEPEANRPDGIHG